MPGNEFEEDPQDQDGLHAGQLGRWIEDRYVGDDRFESVALLQPGRLENEDFRLRLDIDDASHFFVAVRSEEGFVRVGIATDDSDISEKIEEFILEAGGSMTDFLSEALEGQEELDYEVHHFHDDAYYFCSEIRFDVADELGSESLREEIVSYLEGYIAALLAFMRSGAGG